MGAMVTPLAPSAPPLGPGTGDPARMLVLVLVIGPLGVSALRWGSVLGQ
jgi:hypothetical protein